MSSVYHLPDNTVVNLDSIESVGPIIHDTVQNMVEFYVNTKSGRREIVSNKDTHNIDKERDNIIKAWINHKTNNVNPPGKYEKR